MYKRFRSFWVVLGVILAPDIRQKGMVTEQRRIQKKLGLIYLLNVILVFTL